MDKVTADGHVWKIQKKFFFLKKKFVFFIVGLPQDLLPLCRVQQRAAIGQLCCSCWQDVLQAALQAAIQAKGQL